MNHFKVVPIVRRVAHTGALVFGAFWLVATSAPTVPARQCFSGIDNPTTLQVALGMPPSTGDAGVATEASCQGIDGLMAGSTLSITLSQGARRETTPDACWAYETQAIQGATDVTLYTAPNPLGDALDGLTIARGQFSSSTAQGCRGEWELTLAPNVLPDPGMTISPLDAGPTTWHVERSIEIDQAQFCNGAFTASGSIACEDFFPVTTIAQVSP